MANLRFPSISIPRTGLERYKRMEPGALPIGAIQQYSFLEIDHIEKNKSTSTKSGISYFKPKISEKIAAISGLAAHLYQQKRISV